MISLTEILWAPRSVKPRHPTTGVLPELPGTTARPMPAPEAKPVESLESGAKLLAVGPTVGWFNTHNEHCDRSGPFGIPYSRHFSISATENDT